MGRETRFIIPDSVLGSALTGSVVVFAVFHRASTRVRLVAPRQFALGEFSRGFGRESFRRQGGEIGVDGVGRFVTRLLALKRIGNLRVATPFARGRRRRRCCCGSSWYNVLTALIANGDYLPGRRRLARRPVNLFLTCVVVVVVADVVICYRYKTTRCVVDSRVVVVVVASLRLVRRAGFRGRFVDTVAVVDEQSAGGAYWVVFLIVVTMVVVVEEFGYFLAGVAILLATQ